jgi:hypothetical protein
VLAIFYYIVCCFNSVFHFIVPGTVNNFPSVTFTNLNRIADFSFLPLFAAHDVLSSKRALMMKFGGH